MAVEEITSVRLANAVTTFDRRESRKKHYNIYALGMYLRAVRQVETDVEYGATLRQAILVNFNGKLLTAALKAVGEPDFTRDEMLHANVTWARPERTDD